ncbi:hypothetical protein F5B21DRAFT_464013, partial [Xylaria acuta]
MLQAILDEPSVRLQVSCILEDEDGEKAKKRTLNPFGGVRNFLLELQYLPTRPASWCWKWAGNQCYIV